MYEGDGGGDWDEENDVPEQKTFNFNFKIGPLHENGNDDIINNLSIDFGFSVKHGGGDANAGQDFMTDMGNENSSEIGSHDQGEGIEQNCCPNPAITFGEITTEGASSLSRAGVIGLGWTVINGLFGSAHIPADPATVGINYGNVRTLADIKEAVRSPAVKSRGNQVGSYTIVFSNDQKYHGKGPLPRMMLSAAQHSIANKVMVKSMQWTPSATDRQAFKDEYRRMQTDAVLPTYPQGVNNPINYNIRQSPGYLYIQQDGF